MRIGRPGDLTRVVDLARKVLADLDPEEIPAPLVRVVTQTGRSLVPPLQRRLIDEIDSNEWLRNQVAEKFDGAVDTDDPLEKAAALFLHRPDGWEDELGELARRSEHSAQADRIETMIRRIERLQTELESWRNRAKRNRRLAEEAAAQADRRVAAARAGAPRGPRLGTGQGRWNGTTGRSEGTWRQRTPNGNCCASVSPRPGKNCREKGARNVRPILSPLRVHGPASTCSVLPGSSTIWSGPSRRNRHSRRRRRFRLRSRLIFRWGRRPTTGRRSSGC